MHLGKQDIFVIVVSIFLLGQGGHHWAALALFLLSVALLRGQSSCQDIPILTIFNNTDQDHHFYSSSFSVTQPFCDS
jgi:hypothetical protein